MWRRALSLVVLGVLAVPFAASADTWAVDYFKSGDISQAHTFYGAGSYDFLLRADYVPVYLAANNQWNFIGFYGAVALPADLPPIAFPDGTDQGVAHVVLGTGGGGIPVIGAASPLDVLEAPDIYLVRAFQKAAAITATGILHLRGAPVTRSDTTLHLPWVTVEVYRQCAGLATIAVILAGVLAGSLLAQLRWRYMISILALSVPIGVLINANRIADIALRGFE